MHTYKVTIRTIESEAKVAILKAGTYRKALNKVKIVFDLGKVLKIRDCTYSALGGKHILLEHSGDVIDFERITNDTNGNPRYVCHYLDISNDYSEALKLMKAVGGKKFNNKKYGGGIVFQSYNTANTKRAILKAVHPLIG